MKKEKTFNMDDFTVEISGDTLRFIKDHLKIHFAGDCMQKSMLNKAKEFNRGMIYEKHIVYVTVMGYPFMLFPIPTEDNGIGSINDARHSFREAGYTIESVFIPDHQKRIYTATLDNSVEYRRIWDIPIISTCIFDEFCRFKESSPDDFIFRMIERIMESRPTLPSHLDNCVDRYIKSWHNTMGCDKTTPLFRPIVLAPHSHISLDMASGEDFPVNARGIMTDLAFRLKSVANWITNKHKLKNHGKENECTAEVAGRDERFTTISVDRGDGVLTNIKYIGHPLLNDPYAADQYKNNRR